MFWRILASTLFFLGIFLFPWYVTVALAFVVLALSAGYEIIIGGVFLDLLYGVAIPEYVIAPFIFTALFSVLYLASIFVKRRLVFYQQA